MQRRAGLTLVEVLVAIFIMGIGLIALLTLFPIGILRLAQAIRDERTAQAAASASAIANMYDVRNDPMVLSTAPGTAFEPTIPDVFRNPYPLTPAGVPSGFLPADDFGPSYPVFADSVGYYSGNGAQDWVAGATGYLRRRPVSFAPNLPATTLTFKIWDDLTFDTTFDPTMAAPATTRPGTPKILAPSAPLTIQRDPRYSWAYLLRRPQTADRSVVECTVVVFDKRPTITLAEFQYPNTYFDPTKNTITVDVQAAPLIPNIRQGDWIYDGSLYPPTAPKGAHGTFYRVVGITELVLGGNRCVRYEVQTPIRGFTPAEGWPAASFNATFGGFPGTSLVMDGVAEVFEKGPVQAP